MIGGRNLEMIETVAAGLGQLRKEAVFVGGASTCLHIDDPAAEGVRPTEDVDCVIEVSNRTGYSQVEKRLRGLGFSHVMEPGHPICRWRFRGVLVDVMPDDPSILGFSNRWYAEGIENARGIVLPSGLSILSFTLPYFIASKLEAFKSRGSDPRMSHDIEDIIIVLDGKLDFDDIVSTPATVTTYLKEKFQELLSDPSFVECVYGHLPHDPSKGIRAKRILSFLNSCTKSWA